MTQDGQMVTCDFCADEPKRVAVGRVSFQKSWETVVMRNGPDLHLCPVCAGLKSAGRLVEGYLYMECVRCGRNTDEHRELKRWCPIGEGQYMCEPCANDAWPDER